MKNHVNMFYEKIKKININNIEEEIIKKIKINNNQKNYYLEKISIINKDEKGDIIIEPFKKEDIKKIANTIKEICKNNSIIVSKNFIKIINQKILTKEEKKNIIKIIKNEKEKYKIILRNIRRKEKNKKNIDEKEIKMIIEKNINKLEEIYKEKIKNIK